MPNKSSCCYGGSTIPKFGQYRYELLFTSLVSDKAIARGMADFLVDMSEVTCSTDSRSMQQMMVRTLPPDILRELANVLAEVDVAC